MTRVGTGCARSKRSASRKTKSGRVSLSTRRTEMKRTLAIVASAVLGVLASTALAEGQPHMHHALTLLEEARGELERATHDKGGHRAKAIEHVDVAIGQLR